MESFNKIVFFLLSIILALGTINPFSPSLADEVASETFLVPIFVLLFIIYTVFVNFKKGQLPILNPVRGKLFVFLFILFLSDFLYNPFEMNFIFILKLATAIIFFLVLSWYLILYPDTIDKSLLLYAFTCFVIVGMTFSGMLNNYILVNNGRLWLFGENPNSTSSRMSIAVLILLYFITKNQYCMFYKMIFLLMSGCILLYVFLSGSRGSLLSVAFGFFLILFFSNVSHRIKVFIILGILTFTVIYIPELINSDDFGIFRRFQYMEQYGDIRNILMKQAMNIYYDNPIIGCGENGYKIEKQLRHFDSHDSHCIITSILAMGGTFGVIFFISFIFILFRGTLKVKNKSILPMLLLLTMFLISLKTGGVITFILMWYLYAIVFALNYRLRHNENSFVSGMEY